MAGKWRGKGNQAKGQKNSQPQVLELQFHERANNLFELLMNWNTPPQSIEGAWREVMQLRSNCMKAYGSTPSGGMGAMCLPDGSANWKSEMQTELAKHLKRSLTKDDQTYDVSEVEGKKPGIVMYVASLRVNGFENSYQGDEPSKSKKEAEHLAAKALMEAEFPQAYKRLANASGFEKFVAGKGGQKRSAAVMSVPVAPTEAKQRLAHAAQLLMPEGNLPKGDIVYECTEGDAKGQYTATVTLTSHDPSTGYQGLPGKSKKEAENQAAEAALAALADTIKEAEAEHKAKKKLKMAPKIEDFKKKMADRAAEKKAAKTANPGLN